MSHQTEFHEIISEYVTIPVQDEQGSSTMDAYMAHPTQEGNNAGIIVGFELFGLTGHIRNIVDRLARLGYVVIAPDFYHRSAPRIELEATAEGRTRGFALLHQLTRTQALNDVHATMAYLREEEHITHIGMVGFSVGGHIAYLAATQFDLQATVAYYPGWLPVTDIPLSQPTPTLSLTSGIAEHNGSLLFFVGEQDALIPQEQRETIIKALRDAHVQHEFITYPNTPHGFFCDERDSYHKASAEDSWERMSQLFATNLAHTE